MATGLNVRSRRLVMAIFVTAMVLVVSVYGPVGLENALGLEFRRRRSCRARDRRRRLIR